MSRRPHPVSELQRRYELTGPLGVGARGLVWHGRERSTSSSYAVKTLQKCTATSTAVLKSEFRTLVRCAHPHIVTPHRLFVTPGASWFEMEQVDGVRIDRWAKHLPREWSPQLDQRFRTVAGQLVSAVHAVHRCGLVHRDLKPANLLVQPDDRLVLLDFDLAAPPSAEQDRATILGTPGYRSPEQALGLPIGREADWYAVGAVLHEVLVGQPPFGRRPRASLRAQRRLRPPDLHTVRPDIPVDITRLIRDLLQPEPSARPNAAALMKVFPCPVDPEPTVSRGTVDQLQRLLDAPSPCWLELAGGDARTRRAAIQRAVRGENTHITVRVDPREVVPNHLLDAIAGSVVQHLRRLPREQRTSALPRDHMSLLDSFPDFVLLPELSSYAPTDGSGAPRPLADLLQRLSRAGGVRILLEDLHLASASDLDQLHALTRLPIDCTVVTEGEPVADPGLRTRLEAIRRTFPQHHSIRVRSGLAGP